MPAEFPPSGRNTAAQVGFWLLVGLQWLLVPFVLLTALFGVAAWEHLSPEDGFQILLLLIYPVWLVAVGFLGKARLKHRKWLAAYALGLSPLLLLASWLPLLAEV